MKIITRDISDSYLREPRHGQLKYIRGHYKEEELMIIFGPQRTHKEVVENFRINNLESAGYIHYQDDKWSCYGESTTLLIKSKIEDTIILLNWLKEKSEGEV